MFSGGTGFLDFDPWPYRGHFAKPQPILVKEVVAKETLCVHEWGRGGWRF